jgi:hypothetical protein
MQKYGNPIGPTVDWLLAHGHTLDDIIDVSSMQTSFWYNLFFLSF